MLCELQPTQAQGSKVGVINHPGGRGRGESGVERDFDLARVDEKAGVRKGHENMET